MPLSGKNNQKTSWPSHRRKDYTILYNLSIYLADTGPLPQTHSIPSFFPDAVQFWLYGIQSVTRSRCCFSMIISCQLQNIGPKTLFFPVFRPYFYKTYIFWSNLIHNHPLIYSPSPGCRCITSQGGSIRHQQTMQHPQSDLQEYFGIRPNTHIPGRGFRLPNVWKEISYELFQE